MKNLSILTLYLLSLSSCESPDRAQPIIDHSIQAHGFKNLKGKAVTFVFRNRNYSVSRTENHYIYTRSFVDSTGYVIDSLINSSDFIRKVNGTEININEEWKARYSRSVNSVLYFFQLPFPLNDPAAIKSFEGEITIKGEPYYLVKVTFQEQGGGEDHEDEFMYWFHRDHSTMDYFAYSYQTDGGGVRFREAINRREIEGMLFQDYINYEVEKGTPLHHIPQLYEKGQLKVLSRIENNTITVRPY